MEVDLELVDVERFKANYTMELNQKMETQLKRKNQGSACAREPLARLGRDASHHHPLGHLIHLRVPSTSPRPPLDLPSP